MRDKPINIQQIRYRQNLIKDDGLCHVLEGNCKNISSMISQVEKDSAIESFFGLCRSTTSVDSFITECIQYINEASDCERNILGGTFVTQLLPMATPSKGNRVALKNISDESIRENAMQVLETARLSDKILSNHNVLMKRYDVNTYVQENQFSDPKDICIQICEWIDTYNTPAYAKTSIAIDEATYMLQKYCIDYNRQDMVKTIVEYFLISCNPDPKSISKVLKENACISKEDTDKVSYILTEKFDNSIDGVVDKCVSDMKLDEGRLKYYLRQIYSKSVNDMVHGTPSVLNMLRQLLAWSSFGISVIVGAPVVFVDAMLKHKMTRKQVEQAMHNFKQEKYKTEQLISKEKDKDKKHELEVYKKNIEYCIEKLDEYRINIYTDEEYAKLKDMTESVEENYNYITLDELKLFKFNNLMNMAYKAADFVADKTQGIVNKAKGKIKSIVDKDVDKEGNLIKKKPSVSKFLSNITDAVKNSHFVESCITPEGYMDITVSKIMLEGFDEDVYLSTLKICDELNNMYSNEDVGFYVNSTESIFEVHMCYKNKIALSESEEMIIAGQMPLDTLSYAGDVVNYCKLVERLKDAKPDSLYRDMMNSRTMTPESLSMIADINKIAGNDIISLDEWTNLVDTFKYHPNVNDSNYASQVHENSRLNECTYNFNDNVDYPLEIQVEAVEIMRNIVNEGLDLNSIKLAIQGMKNKVKNLSTKEKEISRDIDVAANGFTRSVQSALTNDRREAIIKGSVIPSFSKCIKAAIAAGGVALVVNPTTAIISCIGALAASKHLNDKERMLLLDEIDVELKVVEKELQIAENNNDMKKYRQLLAYQRKLKKEDFKLRYKLSRKTQRNYLTKTDIGREDDD